LSVSGAVTRIILTYRLFPGPGNWDPCLYRAVETALWCYQFGSTARTSSVEPNRSP